jgi:hypothetical protein
MVNMKKINVRIEGITPLLMNRFRDAQIEGKTKKHSGSAKEQNPEDKLYLHDGVPHLPAVYLRNALIDAAKQFKLTGKGKSTWSKVFGSSLDVKPEMSAIEPAGWVVYRIAAVNPMTKGRMMVSRPRFDKWGATFDLELLDDSIPAEVVKEVIDHAGLHTGVGDWRPEKKGMFGKFIVTEFKEE